MTSYFFVVNSKINENNVCSQDVFEKHAALFSELGVNPNNGLGDVYDKVKGHPKQAEVEADIQVWKIL